MLTKSKLRELFWPIYGEENAKFIPMLAMLAFALFSYTSLRITKDALVVTAPGSGAGVLNFLKGYVVMFATILFVVWFSFMSSKFDEKKLFYITLMPFFIFFVIFAFILYPFSEYLHMSKETLFAMQLEYPRLRYIIPIFGYWTFSLFYVFAELWGNVVITLLFWNFANFHTKPNEIKRFYPLFGSYANIGLIAAGLIQRNQVGTELTCALVIFAACAIIALYWYLNKYVLISQDVQEKKLNKKPKEKLSFSESLKLITHSKYLGYIAIIVLSYGMIANLVEITWKEQVKLLYPNKMQYQKFMGDFFIMTGVATLFIGFFTKSFVVRFGWFVSAAITPIVLLVTSIMFYLFAIFPDYVLPSHLLIGSFPLVFAVTIGAFQNIASKGTKYSLFDPTTQMAYVPLDDDLKLKGKAAVDVIGGRGGKSLGGHVQSLALVITGGSQTSIAPFLMCVVCVIAFLWLYSLSNLAKEYASMTKAKA